MNGLFTSLLGFNWSKAFPADHTFHWVAELFTYLSPILYAIMAVVGAAGAVYAIVLGINLARAEDQSKRDEAKKRLIYTLIAVAITVALIIFFNELFPLILSAVSDTSDPFKDKTTTQGMIGLIGGIFR